MKSYMMLIVALIMMANTVTAQQDMNQPTVQVIPQDVIVSPNQLFTTDVMVSGARNIAAADIEFNTSPCGKIERIILGDYLPTDEATGGYALKNEFNDSTARLATAVTDQSKIATKDGLFMRVVMRPMCEEDSLILTVSSATLVDDLLVEFQAQTYSATVLISNGERTDLPITAIVGAIFIIIGFIGLLVLLFLFRRNTEKEKRG